MKCPGHIAYLLLLIILQFTNSCNFTSQDKTKTIAGNTGKDSAYIDQLQFKKVTINNDYEILIPGYMAKTTTLNQDASLQYQNIFKEIFIIIIDENISQSKKALKKIEAYDSTKSFVDNYIHFQTAFIKENLETHQIKTNTSIRTGAHKGKLIEMEGNYNQKNVYYRLTFFTSEEKIYMLMFWSLNDNKSEYFQDIKHMMNSFKIL